MAWRANFVGSHITHQHIDGMNPRDSQRLLKGAALVLQEVLRLQASGNPAANYSDGDISSPPSCVAAPRLTPRRSP